MKPFTIPPGALLHYTYKAPAGQRAAWAVPKDRTGPVDVCPYCHEPVGTPTRDHVFPQFLGGRRWVHSCKPCNNTFGHTIEGAAEAEVFTPNYVFLSVLGLKHIRPGAIWKNAFERDGSKYHLIAGDGSVEERLAHPVIVKDESGRITSARFPDEKMAKGIIEHAARERLPLKVEREANIAREIPNLVCGLDFGSLLVRPALKISLAAATMLGVDRSRLAQARADLRATSNVVERCTVVAIDYVDIKEFAKPLAHVVYVEQTPERVYAVVQFFGVLQIWCGLSDVRTSCERQALFGTLDPLTGKERFDFTTPLNLPIILGDPIPKEAYSIESLSQWIVSGLQEQAIKRGGKDVGLRVHSHGTTPAPPISAP